MDEGERASRGYVSSLADLHPDRQEEFNQSNNEHVLICFLCGEEKMEKLHNSNERDLMR